MKLKSALSAVILAVLSYSAAAKPLFDMTFEKPASFRDFLSQTQGYVTFEPTLIVNTSSGTASAPSPIVYPFSIGASWPSGYFISFQPRLSFFMNYYLWDGEKALPAEIENRTATSLSFLLALPASLNFDLSEKSRIEASVGLALLMRFAVLSNGVGSSDSGASGSAGDDVSHIADWFWSGARPLYLQTGCSYIYEISGRIKAGPDLQLYFPLGSIFGGRGLDAMILSTGIKLVF